MNPPLISIAESCANYKAAGNKPSGKPVQSTLEFVP